MFFEKIQAKNSIIFKKIQGKKAKVYFRPKQTRNLELRGIALQPLAPAAFILFLTKFVGFGCFFSVYTKFFGAKGNCPTVANLLFAPSGPSFLLSVHPCTLTLSSLLKALKGRKKVSIPLSS